MPESTEQYLKDYLDDRLAKQNDYLGKKIDELRETMDNRVRTLETQEAYRKGLENAAKVVTVATDGSDWKMAFFKLLAITATLAGSAGAAAVLVGKVITK